MEQNCQQVSSVVAVVLSVDLMVDAFQSRYYVVAAVVVLVIDLMEVQTDASADDYLLTYLAD